MCVNTYVCSKSVLTVDVVRYVSTNRCVIPSVSNWVLLFRGSWIRFVVAIHCCIYCLDGGDGGGGGSHKKEKELTVIQQTTLALQQLGIVIG